MNADELLVAASQSGFEVTNSNEPVAPAAARLLPNVPGALAVAVAGDVLRVVIDHLPSPAEFRQLEQTAGMLVTLAVVTPEDLAALRGKVAGIVDNPVTVGPALETAVELKASDVHLAAGSVPILRVDGDLRPVPGWAALSAADMDNAAAWLLGGEHVASEHDVAVTYAGARWRASVYRQRGATAITLRRITDTIPRLEDLGLPAAVATIAERQRGLVLFCGATGSGKSTSMAAVIDRINRTRSCKIITLEDPVEYVHRSHRAIVHQREVGHDTPSFASGLRAALRQDPDVILVGEMRDRETIHTALTAAETGHLVVATLHSSTAAGAVERIVDTFPAEQQDQIRVQLASVLEVVTAQQLLPRRGGGRQLVSEVLVATSGVRSLIREGRLHEIPTVLEAGAQFGMTSMDKSLAELVAAGRIDAPVAERSVHDFASYQEHLRRAPKAHAAIDAIEPNGGLRW